MGRRKDLRGTDAHLNGGVDPPFFDDFFTLLEPSNKRTMSSALHRAYMRYVKTRAGENRGAVFLSERANPFYRALKDKLKAVYKMERCDRKNQKGYNVVVKSMSRSAMKASESVSEPVEARTYEAEDGRRIHEVGYMKIMYLDKNCGRSAFALMNIKKDTRVVEYRGQRIKKAIGDKRLDDYTAQGIPSTMFDLYNGMSIDGQRHEEGERDFHEYENPAAYINSQTDINLKVVFQNKRAYLHAMFDIPKNMELFWNYNCPKSELTTDQADFMLKRKYPPADE